MGECLMIFVTVGTQLAFDRLISTVDNWNHDKGLKFFIQTGPSAIEPKHADFARFIDPSKADQLFKEAELIISHAGMGSILTALRYQKPIIIMPRLARLGEHRNDHQLATCKWLGNKPGIMVANDEQELVTLLDRSQLKTFNTGQGISSFASEALIDNLRKFFNQN